MSLSRTAANVRDLKMFDEKFQHLSALLYDTSVTQERLDTEVMPFIDEAVTFKDPWQADSGKARYRAGLGGFHAMFRFVFEFRQVSVSLNSDHSGGRAIVDGVMQLKQFSPLFTYPLRTILVYDFVIPDPSKPDQFLITTHEEMWSFGDMIEAVPLVGRWYARAFRPGFAKGFLAASRVAVRARAALGA